MLCVYSVKETVSCDFGLVSVARSHFFAPSDYDALEYVLSLFTSTDDVLLDSYLVRQPEGFFIVRLGFFDSNDVFVPCLSDELFSVSDVRDFCALHNFDGSYTVLDFLTDRGALNVWTDRWNEVLRINTLHAAAASSIHDPSVVMNCSDDVDRCSHEDAGTSQGSPTTPRSESSCKSAGSSADFISAGEQCLPPQAESEDKDA